MQVSLSKGSKYAIVIIAAVALGVAVPLIAIAIKRYYIGMNTSNHLNDMSYPRGYRNNNPLNIRKGTSNWAGRVLPGADKSFEQFENMGYGFRAGLKTLRTYISKGYNTIEKMISRWAPESDGNNTASYIEHVAKRAGIAKDRVIGRNDREALVSIAYAMAISENGSAPLRSDIEAGWEMI